MKSLTSVLCRVLAVGALLSAGLALQPGAAFAAGASTCSGGHLAAGTYTSLTVAGQCAIDSGNVVVQTNVTVQPGGALLAVFGGSNLRVTGNLAVLTNGILVLGCEPGAFVCRNDPDQDFGTLSTSHVVGGNLTGSGALMMLVHNNTITGNVGDAGGGGGVTCDTQPLGPEGPPAYSTFEDNQVGRDLSVSGLRTCWLGLFRNNVAGNVNFSSNTTADPDGNEVATNRVAKNLSCTGNSPAAQIGDSEGNPNIVSGLATGQCAVLV